MNQSLRSPARLSFWKSAPACTNPVFTIHTVGCTSHSCCWNQSPTAKSRLSNTTLGLLLSSSLLSLSLSTKKLLQYNNNCDNQSSAAGRQLLAHRARVAWVEAKVKFRWTDEDIKSIKQALEVLQRTSITATSLALRLNRNTPSEDTQTDIYFWWRLLRETKERTLARIRLKTKNAPACTKSPMFALTFCFRWWLPPTNTVQ